MRSHIILPELTPIQMEIVNGSLLGDANLYGRKSIKANWRFDKSQSILDYRGENKQNKE